MKKKLIIIIPSIIILIALILVSYIMLSPKKYTLNNNNNKIYINIKNNKEKKIKLKIENDNNIVLSKFNNKKNSNYIIYLLKDTEDKIIKKGILHNTDDTVIYDVKKGDYTLSFVYFGKNKFKLEGNIKLQKEEEKEYSTLQNGMDIKSKITELTNRDFKDETIKSIKLAKEMNKEFENDNYIVSTGNSSKPIYMWVEEDTIYFYSENSIEFNENAYSMFSYLSALTDVNDLKYFNADKIEDMSYMFKADENLSDIKFISYFNTPKLKDMSDIFSDCYALIDITPLVSLNTTVSFIPACNVAPLKDTFE